MREMTVEERDSMLAQQVSAAAAAEIVAALPQFADGMALVIPVPDKACGLVVRNRIRASTRVVGLKATTVQRRRGEDLEIHVLIGSLSADGPLT